jgi:hypothetical protein
MLLALHFMNLIEFPMNFANHGLGNAIQLKLHLINKNPVCLFFLQNIL